VHKTPFFVTLLKEAVQLESIDFSRSFLTWLLKEQSGYGRFNIEAVLRTSSEDFLLLSGVMAANVYGKENLILKPAYEFAAVFGKSRYRIFRTHALYNETQDTLDLISDRFQSVERHLARVSGPVLSTPQQIIEATRANQILNAHMRLPTCELIFPVKHINVQTDRNEFQVETGPILFPGNFKSIELAAFQQAFIVFNRLHQAEFAVRDAVKVDNTTIRHYETIEKHAASIQLVAI
jgi:hypothetical protein